MKEYRGARRDKAKKDHIRVLKSFVAYWRVINGIEHDPPKYKPLVKKYSARGEVHYV